MKPKKVRFTRCLSFTLVSNLRFKPVAINLKSKEPTCSSAKNALINGRRRLMRQCHNEPYHLDIRRLAGLFARRGGDRRFALEA